MPFRRGGTMVQCSSRKRKFLFKQIGTKRTRHFNTSNYDEIDPSNFKPKLVNCRSPNNCVYTTLTGILTGSIKAASAIQDWVRKIRKGRCSYLYDDYENEVPASGFVILILLHGSTPASLLESWVLQFMNRSSSQPSGLSNADVTRGVSFKAADISIHEGASLYGS